MRAKFAQLGAGFIQPPWGRDGHSWPGRQGGGVERLLLTETLYSCVQAR